jgi:hypothetical protein
VSAYDVVGRCWACGEPVRREQLAWVTDTGVVSARTSKPTRRRTHAGECRDRAEQVISDHGAQMVIGPVERATARGAPRRPTPDPKPGSVSKLPPLGEPAYTYGALKFYTGKG